MRDLHFAKYQHVQIKYQHGQLNLRDENYYTTQADSELEAEKEKEAKEEEEVAVLEREVEENIAEVLISDVLYHLDP